MILYHAPISISIHAPRVGSDVSNLRTHRAGRGISIHAPRVGSDGTRDVLVTVYITFQSTLPVWGATIFPIYRGSSTEGFQSTLPVWGATVFCIHRFHRRLYFNPRSPCGERQHLQYVNAYAIIFQSTLPVWGATVKKRIFYSNFQVFSV